MPVDLSEYKHFDVQSVGGAIGAEISGIDTKSLSLQAVA